MVGQSVIVCGVKRLQNAGQVDYTSARPIAGAALRAINKDIIVGRRLAS